MHSTSNDPRLNVVATRNIPDVLTTDHHGLVSRTVTNLIFHAAARYSCDSGNEFFWERPNVPVMIAHMGRPC